MVSNQTSKDAKGRYQGTVNQPAGVGTGNSAASIGSPTPGPQREVPGRVPAGHVTCHMYVYGPRRPGTGAAGLGTTCVSDQVEGYNRPEPISTEPTNTTPQFLVATNPSAAMKPSPTSPETNPVKLERKRRERKKRERKRKRRRENRQDCENGLSSLSRADRPAVETTCGSGEALLRAWEGARGPHLSLPSDLIANPTTKTKAIPKQAGDTFTYVLLEHF